MSNFSELLGATLLAGSAGETIKTASLEGHYLGLYFSAHWCGPCRKFTPSLVTFYNKFRKEFKEKKKFDIVFVSSDNSEEAFNEYYRSMPWKAVPFDEPTRTKLGRKFKVEGIPTLVILGPDGATLTSSGVEAVAANDLSLLFPLPLWDSLSGVKVADNKGKECTIESVRAENDVIGFYFSASWCPPCRAFTPKLVEAYQRLKGAGHKVEIIFASSDKDQASWKTYFGSMPWKALPLKSIYKEQLSNRYQVQGIPTLVFIEKSGKTITTNGRGLVIDEIEDFPWTKKKSFTKLAAGNLDLINDEPVLIAFFDAKDEEKYKAELTPVTSEFCAQWEGKDAALRFLYGAGDAIADRLKAFIQLSRSPAFVILNLPDGEKFLPASAEFSADAMKVFANSYLGGREGLTKKPPREA